MSADGPYVIYEPDGKVCVISVTAQGQIEDTTYTVLPQDFTLHVTDHKGRYPFDVKLHPVKRPEWQYRQPDKVAIMRYTSSMEQPRERSFTGRAIPCRIGPTASACPKRCTSL